MIDPVDQRNEPFLKVMALHQYFLNADFLRDTFMHRIKREQSPAEVDLVSAMDDMIAMSLWYATLYVVIEGWRKARLSHPEVDALLAEDRVEDLRRFRNQVFHYQREFDNPRLLEFLGHDDADARTATDWAKRTHAALGRAIRMAAEDLFVHEGGANSDSS